MLPLGFAVVAMALAAPQAAAQTPPAAPPAATVAAAYPYTNLFPREFPGVGFTMPKQAFLDMISARQLAFTANGGNTVFAVAVPDAPFREVVFFFNSDAGEYLTEIEIRFADDEKARAFFTAAYSPRNAEGDFVLHDGVSPYRAKAWQFRNRVYLVAAMLNTRWANQ